MRLVPERSDALVLFGATGDLAYEQIFPALQQMVLHGELTVPVIGVAKAGWNLEQLRQRAHDSLAAHGGVNETAFAKLVELLQYIDGDYQDPETFKQLRTMLGPAKCFKLFTTELIGYSEAAESSVPVWALDSENARRAADKGEYQGITREFLKRFS